MNRDRLTKLKFKAYQEIVWTSPHQKYSFDCMLVAVDFDNETFLLRPFPLQTITSENGDQWTVNEGDFWTSINNCDLAKPKSKLKLA
jgi:hypothetical protein